jgi:type VI secretion system secreted protein VgrG
MALNQATRLLGLKSPLGENELLLTGFEGREAISQLFSFQLTMISENVSIAPTDIVGKNVTFSIKLADDSPRFFNGFVSRFGAGDEDEKGRRVYAAEVVPWLWFLTRTTDCRIFQEMKVGDIIEKIFSDCGFTDFQVKLSGNHPKREYCVQYRETDFNFVSRLLEEEGIFYFFTHKEGKHTLIMSDKKSDYVICQESEVAYPRDSSSRAIRDHITSWEHVYEFRTGKYAQTDYNFTTPSTNLMTNSKTVVKLPAVDKYEFYDYPGIYLNKSDGGDLTDLRMEEEEAQHDVVQATSLCRTFTPGGVFKVQKHRAGSEEGKKYVITSIEHSAIEPHGYETGVAASFDYRNKFTCIPDSVTARPQRTTRKPFVQGVQTAVVVGPSGEEIYPDEYGRVKVQFFWDREGKKDDKSSCWVRVSQNWAGQTWGGMFIPHVGQEVIVDFLEGDADRPIITGRVYNAEQTVPLELPDNKTKCIIRDYGDNQMIWEGKPDEQFIHIQQECGHELLMNGMKGRESIQLRDMYGNEIFMDSVNGTMRFTSPTHNSTMILGNSLFTSVSSDNSTFTEGNTLNVHRGIKHDIYCGQRSQTDLGNYIESMAGLKTTCVIGQEVNFRAGFTLNLQYAKEVTENKFDYVQHAIGAMKLDSEEQVGIVGGAGDAAIARFAKDGIVLSYNEQPNAQKRGAVSAAGWIAAAAAFFTFSTAAAEGVAIGMNKDDLDQEVTSRAKSWTDSTLGEATGYSAGGIGAVTAVAGMLTGGNKSDTKDWSDGDSEAKIIMSKNGVALAADGGKQVANLEKKKGITIQSKDGFVKVESEKVIVLNAGSAVVYTAPKYDYKSGKIIHKNIKVLD